MPYSVAPVSRTDPASRGPLVGKNIPLRRYFSKRERRDFEPATSGVTVQGSNGGMSCK